MREKEGIKDIFNAAVPFMPEDKRRQMFIFTKLMEIMDYKEDMSVFENVNEDKKKRRDRFLKSVSPFVTEEEKNDIDMLVKIIELKRIMG